MVENEIRKILGESLPEKSYEREEFGEKADLTF